VAQQRASEIIERFPIVDAVIGTHRVGEISDIIAEIKAGNGPIVSVEFSDECRIDSFPRRRGGLSAFVTITQGCDNFCSYCIVPFVRGRESSRPGSEILRDVTGLVSDGTVEITLLGQNVNSYRDPEKGIDFPELLMRTAEIPGVKRIRFTTSHPKDLSDKLVSAFQSVPSLCSHVHLPLQSGSTRVLSAMNRKYTKEEYLEKIDRLKDTRSDLAVTTDIIVGFPGETIDDFEQTLEVMERVKFDGAYSFKYSSRPLTKASYMKECIGDEEKSRRLAILQEIQKEHTLIANRLHIDTIKEVLAIGTSLRDPDVITGRSVQNKVVNFTGHHEDIGSLIPVRITEARNNSLLGEAIHNHSIRSM
jgi:tRNA-2-methylthio-N6-dimethylallyladenosine synthase